MTIDLIQIHQGAYQEDLPFWETWTAGVDPILELGCGFGRLTIPLVKLGHQVVGLDRDLTSLRVLRSKLKETQKAFQHKIHLFQADMLSFYTSPVFRRVILPCNTYSVFSATERKRLLTNVKRALLPEGMFIISLPNPHRMKTLYDELRGRGGDSTPDLETTFFHPVTGNPVQVSSQVTAVTDGVRWDWMYDQLLPDGSVDRRVYTTIHKLCSLEIHQQEFEAEDFRVTTCQGDFIGSAYHTDSPYLILIAQKK